MTDTVHSSDNTNSNQTLNKLRAAVLGANDGVVSISSILMGVAGANASHGAIVTAGLAALVAGALSMAVGEYVSVSSQSDAEKAYIDKEKRELRENPAAELEELTAGYEAKGLSRKTAHLVAKELTAIDPVKAHLAMEFQLDEEDVVNPMHAAVASFISFTAGGLIPFLAMLLAPTSKRIPATIIAVFLALLLTGYGSARVGGASHGRAMARVVLGGLAAMAITYYVGQLFGAKIG